MKAVLAVVLSAWLLCLPESSSAVLTEVLIFPANPMVGTEVTVHVSGFGYDLCWYVADHTINQSNNVFTIDIFATDRWEPGLACAQATSPYSIDYELGMLPAGTYAIRVVEHGQSLRHPFTNNEHASFAVGGAAFNCNCSCYTDFGCSGSIDVTDVVRAMNVAFRGYTPESPPQCPWGEMDINCSTVTDILDVIGVIDVAFRGAPASSFCDPCSP